MIFVAQEKGKMMNDLISRQAAIDALMEILDRPNHAEFLYTDEICKALKALPSAQPEIIRCKDCKYRDENWRRVSVRWLPCMEVLAGSNWYCGSAERRTDG